MVQNPHGPRVELDRGLDQIGHVAEDEQFHGRARWLNCEKGGVPPLQAWTHSRSWPPERGRRCGRPSRRGNRVSGRKTHHELWAFVWTTPRLPTSNEPDSGVQLSSVQTRSRPAIVAMPDQLFYNRGIFTYVWIVTNCKELDNHPQPNQNTRVGGV